jgi:tryptophan synthase alpha chain
MTNRYSRAFDAAKNQQRKALIPYCMLGYPDRCRCEESLDLMVSSGATALELGIAFSDPVADGPTIQQAAQQVIRSRFGLSDAFELIARVRSVHKEIPIGLLVYYNTVMSLRPPEFYRKAKAAGVDGILIADLPPESAAEVMESAWAYDIQQIFIVSPLTSEERLPVILQYAGGFVYAVSRLGVTGMEEEHDHQLSRIIKSAKSKSHLPVCVGFGISSPQQASKIFGLGADGVITGSKVIDLAGAAGDNLNLLAQYLHDMSAACGTSCSTEWRCPS